MKVVRLLPLLLVLASCANVVSPTGGDKDNSPPEPIMLTPENESLFFKGGSISIGFDEYIQLKDPFNQVIISPPLNSFPSIKVKGKKILIEIEEELLEETTYTIQFGESIRDITEGNALSNFVYAFSTGSVIDSLQITGTVYDLLTAKPVEGALVLMYRNLEDSAFTTQKPTYFTKASASGAFTIGHIKEGAYRVFALSDQNFNYYYDLPNEGIAFLPTPISITTDSNGILLSLFQEAPETVFVSDARSPSPGFIRVVFGTPLEDYQTNFPGSTIEDIQTYRPSKDSLLIWNARIMQDTQSVHISSQYIDTLLHIPMKKPSDSTGFLTQSNPWKGGNIKSSRDRLPAQDLNKTLQIPFERPLRELNLDLIQCSIDSGRTPIAFTAYIDSQNPLQLDLETKWIMDTIYTVNILPGATKDLFGGTNDSIQYSFQTRHKEDYGVLLVRFAELDSVPSILQLMKKDGSLVREVHIDEQQDSIQITFDYLLPDIYRVRIIKDKNRDGNWTTGNWADQSLPEAVFYYPAEIQIRTNWEQEIEFTINR